MRLEMKTVDECLPGPNREEMTDGAQLSQLGEAATDDTTDVIGHRQFAVNDEAKITNWTKWREFNALNEKCVLSDLC